MWIAASLNTFSSSYFVWLDIGAIRWVGWCKTEQSDILPNIRDEKNNNKQLINVVPPEPGVLLLAMEPFTEEVISQTKATIRCIIAVESFAEEITSAKKCSSKSNALLTHAEFILYSRGGSKRQISRK